MRSIRRPSGPVRLGLWPGSSEGGVAAGQLASQVIHEALASLVERRAEDPNLFYLDGLSQHGAADAEVHPPPDAYIRTVPPTS